ncbi:hypothetical protein D3C86_1971160 [compost metagenome]
MDYRDFERDKRSSAFGKIDNFGENFGRIEIIELGIIFVAGSYSGAFINIVKIVQIVDVENLVNGLTTVATEHLIIKKNLFFINLLSAVKTLF